MADTPSPVGALPRCANCGKERGWFGPCLTCGADLQSSPRQSRLSYTNRARIALFLSPVWLLIFLMLDLADAIWRACVEFGVDLYENVSDTARTWYREVYRVARYGSVRDER